jgi:hypothetical protein
MYVKPIHPPDVVADAIARIVIGHAWSGSVAELLAAINATATTAECLDRAWPASPTALAACLKAQSDALRAHGLRMSVMPAELLVERLPSMAYGARPPQGGASRRAA